MMRYIIGKPKTVLAALLTLLLCATFLPSGAQTRRSVKKKPVYYTVPVNKVMRVRLNEQLSSEQSRVGDRFTVTLVDPVYSSNGVLLAPQGSIITGQVTNLQRAQKDGKPATLDVTFTSLRLPNGVTRQINGSLADLSSSSGSSDNEGTVTANRTSNRKVKFIGGGAAGGAIIGAIAGGGKGALIGGGVGAVAGLIGGKLKKGHEVKVESGTEFGVILNRSFSLPRYASG